MKSLHTLTSFLLFCVFAVLYGCSSGSPRPINYGVDGCHYCKMTVVDKIHGAEFITEKGKVHTFDALECMISFIRENDAAGRYLTNVYEQPGMLVDVEMATFLISKNLPSPMGGNLTAFQTEEAASKLMREKQGELFTWDELMNRSLLPVHH